MHAWLEPSRSGNHLLKLTSSAVAPHGAGNLGVAQAPFRCHGYSSFIPAFWLPAHLRTARGAYEFLSCILCTLYETVRRTPRRVQRVRDFCLRHTAYFVSTSNVSMPLHNALW